jgi:hypothetical protein
MDEQAQQIKNKKVFWKNTNVFWQNTNICCANVL